MRGQMTRRAALKLGVIAPVAGLALPKEASSQVKAQAVTEYDVNRKVYPSRPQPVPVGSAGLRAAVAVLAGKSSNGFSRSRELLSY